MFPLGARFWILRGFLRHSSSLKLGQISVSSLGVAALGERLHFSLLVMSESGAPIYSFESKLVMRYHWKSKAKFAQMGTSLFDEVVTALSALTTLFLGATQGLGGIVVRCSPKLGGGVVDKSPPCSFLQR